MSILQNSNAIPVASSGDFYEYQIPFSARFERASGSYLSRTIQSGGNLRKWTFSFWFKMIGSAGFGSNQYYLATSKLSSPYDTLIFDIDSSSRLYYQTNNNFTQLDNAFRDVTSWGHLHIVYDSDNGTAADRRIVYLNGTRLTVESGQTLGQNTDSKFNSNSVHYIGARQDNSSSHYGSFYLAEVIWADGQAYAPTQFGEIKGGSIWVPRDPSGTNFGTTGYHLKFQDSSALGDDSSGNTNDWTANNMPADHQTIDVPTWGD